MWKILYFFLIPLSMNRFFEFACYVLLVPLGERFKVVDKNGLLVNDKYYRVDKDLGLQTFENGQWNKVSGVYEHFVEGKVFARLVDKNGDVTKFNRQEVLSNSAKVALARENFKRNIYRKILSGEPLNSTEVGTLVKKTPKTIYHWEQSGVVPPSPKDHYGKRIYSLKDLMIFLENVINYPWIKTYYLDMDEIKEVYNYLLAKQAAEGL